MASQRGFGRKHRGVVMGYNYRNPQNRTKAAALLRELKGQLVDVSGITVEAVTTTAATSEAYWQLSKASGVHVYQQDGGWHADLAFKDLPAGVPTIIGTPTPVATRADAVEHIVGMMSVCAQRDNVPAPDPTTGLRYFRFDDHEVPVHPGLLAEYVEKARTLGTDPADVLSDLADIRVEIAGDGPVTQEAWDAAPFQSRYDACKVSCIAMALGIRQITFDPAMAYDLEGALARPAMH